MNLTRTLPTCGTDGCTGHLGKFSSCLTEALHEIALDDADGSTGDGDWHGYFSLVIVAEDETVTVDPDGENRPVQVPAGFYIVQTYTSGAVDHATYDTEAEARLAFFELDNDYAVYLGEDIE